MRTSNVALSVIVLSVAVVAALSCRSIAQDKPAAATTTTASAPASQPSGGMGFRNDGTGIFKDANPPTEWDVEKKKNLVWAVKVGDSKYSSPIVVGGKIFVVCEPPPPKDDAPANAPAGAPVLKCLDAATGKLLWEKKNGFEEAKVKPVPFKGDTGLTTPTPCSDGQNVYVVFATGIVACYGLDGERKWIRHIDEAPASQYGRAASPVLAGDRLLVSVGVLRALDVKTGKEVWKTDLAEEFGTPVVAAVGGEGIIMMAGGKVVRFSDGKTMSPGVGQAAFSSPVFADGVCYTFDMAPAAGEMPAKIEPKMKVKRVWEGDIDPPATVYSSPLCVNGLLVGVTNEGRLCALSTKDGSMVTKRELDIPNGSGNPAVGSSNMYPSLVLAGKYIYLFNTSGDCLVLTPDKDLKEIARNHLPDGSGGMPVFVGKRMYVRGGDMLYCIGE